MADYLTTCPIYLYFLTADDEEMDRLGIEVRSWIREL
jgi:hypothetical protein